MKCIQLQSEVGIDGILELRIPMGIDDAHTPVVVTIEPMPHEKQSLPPTPLEWRRFIEQTYGSCAGQGLEEPPDLPLDARDCPT